VSQRSTALTFMAGIPGRAADDALLAGLLEVQAATQVELVRILLARGTDAALQGLPPLFSKLTPEAQKQVTAHSARMFGALRTCISSSAQQTRQNTLDIVRLSGNPRLAYLAAHAIHDGAQRIRSDAAAALLELTLQHLARREQTLAALRESLDHTPPLLRVVAETLRVHAEEHRHLVDAVRDALEHYESHHRPEVVEAAMLLAPQLEDSLFDQASLKRGKLTHAMIELLGGELQPRFVPFIYVSLAHAEMRRRIVPRIAACRNADFFAEFIRHYWMARDARVAKNLLYIRNLEWLDGGFQTAFCLPPDAAEKLPAWILSLGLSAAQKVSFLTDCLLIDNPPANRAAVWALVDLDTPAATAALQSLLHHESQNIRDIARMETNRRGRAAPAPVRRASARGRPEDWLLLLERANLKEEFEDFWQNHEHIHADQARAAGRHALQFIPGFATQMQIKLLSTSPSDRHRAIRLAAALHLASHFEKSIFAAANDSSPEVRTAAFEALGRIGGETSRRILERALSDAEPTPQAAAIDALDQMAARRRDVLIAPKIESPNADVRSAAVRCLLKLRIPAAAAALMKMLHDSRSDHRCAALWIVDLLKLSALTPRLLTMAGSDPDVRIARIAAHVSRRLTPAATPPTEPAIAGDLQPAAVDVADGSNSPFAAATNSGESPC